MNIRSFILGLGVIATMLIGCNDEVSLVGGSIRPDGSNVNVFADTFVIKATTVKIDSIYARTTSSYLGELYDPLYGNIKSDFICQFYCKDEFTFRKTPLNGEIDSIYLRIDYGYKGGVRSVNSIGDTLTPMHASVFPVVNELPRYYYTNVKPEQFCDMSKAIAEKTYSAYDLAVSDSIRELQDYYTGNYIYLPNVVINLPKELGQKIYDETINNPSSFKTQDAFNKFFPGLYVTTTFGTGNLLEVGQVGIVVNYRYNTELKAADGTDSIANASEIFLTTKEVIQMNRMQSMGLDKFLEPNDEYSYMRTPAGLYTKLEIPTNEIYNKAGDKLVNSLSLSLKAMPEQDWKYALNSPEYLLLMPEDSLDGFFENRKTYDNVTIFRSYAYSSQTYTFDNIARLLKEHKDKGEDENLKLLLVPVRYVAQTDYYGNVISTAIYPYLAPSGVTFRKDEDLMKVKVVTSYYD